MQPPQFVTSMLPLSPHQVSRSPSSLLYDPTVAGVLLKPVHCLMPKCLLEPTHSFEYLGLVLDTAQVRILLPGKKFQIFWTQIQTLHSRSCPTIISSFEAVLFDTFYFRPLQYNILSLWDKSIRSLDRLIHLSQRTSLSLAWWFRASFLPNFGRLVMMDARL